MMADFRRAATAHMARFPLPRKPALRRADADAWLLATDFPSLAEQDAVDALAQSLQADGWHVSVQNGWLYMTPALPDIPLCAPPRNGEAGCAAALLALHPSPLMDERAALALLKASEQSPAQWERACRTLHQSLAELLRLKKPLPGKLLPYLCQAAADHAARNRQEAKR